MSCVLRFVRDPAETFPLSIGFACHAERPRIIIAVLSFAFAEIHGIHSQCAKAFPS